MRGSVTELSFYLFWFGHFAYVELTIDLLLCWIQTSQIEGQLHSDTSPNKVGWVFSATSNINHNDLETAFAWSEILVKLICNYESFFTNGMLRRTWVNSFNCQSSRNAGVSESLSTPVRILFELTITRNWIFDWRRLPFRQSAFPPFVSSQGLREQNTWSASRFAWLWKTNNLLGIKPLATACRCLLHANLIHINSSKNVKIFSMLSCVFKAATFHQCYCCCCRICVVYYFAN